MSEWISVKDDRKPDCAGQGYLVAYLASDKFPSWTWVDYWNGTAWVREVENYKPTHWMPLPKPPYDNPCMGVFYRCDECKKYQPLKKV